MKENIIIPAASLAASLRTTEVIESIYIGYIHLSLAVRPLSCFLSPLRSTKLRSGFLSGVIHLLNIHALEENQNRSMGVTSDVC